MKTSHIAFLMVLLAAPVLAGTYQVVYQERIEGAGGFTHIGPVISSDLSQVAFVYTDTTNRHFVVDFLASDSAVVIETTR